MTERFKGDLELVREVLAGDQGAWKKFEEGTAANIYSACVVVFGEGANANDAYKSVYRQLGSDVSAVLSRYDGRSSLAEYVTIIIPLYLIAEPLFKLLDRTPNDFWSAFEKLAGNMISRVVSGRFRNSDNLESYRQDVILRLIEDDYKRLRAYSGQGNFLGFIQRVVRNICEDIARIESPRARLPAAVERMPKLEQDVFKQLGWHKAREQDLRFHFQDISESRLEEAVINVREHVPVTRSGVMTSLDENIADTGSDPESAVIASEDEVAKERMVRIVREALIELPNEAQLYFKYRLQELKAGKIAEVMGLSVEEIYNKRRSWEKKFAEELVRKGIDKEDMIAVFE